MAKALTNREFQRSVNHPYMTSVCGTLTLHIGENMQSFTSLVEFLLETYEKSFKSFLHGTFAGAGVIPVGE
jgi:hypothetical protein